jgi:UDP-N-acetylmuramate dehydrogenase
MQYYRNFSLKNHNSYHLDSIAKEIWFPETYIELSELLIKLKNFNAVASGTNVLLYPEIDKIICLKNMPFVCKMYEDKLIASGNVLTHNFIEFLLRANIGGFEGLWGIPGTLGGAIVMNAGSGAFVISDYLNYIETVDNKGQRHIYKKDDLKFARRYSILQNKKEILLGAVFTSPKITINQSILKETILFRQNFPKGFSAGGIFKKWYALKPYETEIRKIENPHVKVSSMLNVLIHDGKGTYLDILNFINEIKSIVKEHLELEIKELK